MKERRPKKMVQVWQYRYRNAWGNWLITRRLYTEQEAYDQFDGSAVYQKHAGPYEVQDR